MFIELVDHLRCPASHEETWLVAAVESFHGRYIARGSLGCPICRAQYRVEAGAVCFAAPPSAPEGAARYGEDDVLRARALLGLTDEAGVVGLVGASASMVHALEEQAQVMLLLVNPRGVTPEPGLSTLWVADHFPATSGVLRGALVDASPSPALMEGLVRALRQGGRLVAPVSLPVPAGIKELARDDREWVGEKIAARESAPITLQRARS